MIAINFHPSKKELRTFGLLFFAFSLLVAWSVFRRTGSTPASAVLVAVGVVVAVLGLAAPKAVRPIYVGMMLVTFPIGWVVSHALMAAIFYLVVTPVGVIMRLSGRDPLERAFDKNAKTYWKRRETPSNTERYFRQF